MLNWRRSKKCALSAFNLAPDSRLFVRLGNRPEEVLVPSDTPMTATAGAQDGDYFTPAQWDSADVDGQFLGGTYDEVVIVLGGLSEATSAAAAFLSGNYWPVVVPTGVSEACSVSGGFLSGNYLAVVLQTAASEACSVSGGFLSGDYPEVVVQTNVSEACSLSGGFLSGAYT